LLIRIATNSYLNVLAPGAYSKLDELEKKIASDEACIKDNNEGRKLKRRKK
jgi:hypothetical protein